MPRHFPIHKLPLPPLPVQDWKLRFRTCLSESKCHLLLPQPPLPSSSLHQEDGHLSGKTLLLITLLITAALIIAIFLLCKTFKHYYYSRRRRRRLRLERISSPSVFGSQHSDDDEPPLHPVWYIQTIGLEQSVIDSIALFKYNNNLIHATQCSVCLAQFEQDETLRLLPKCTHAFHVSCIDTWLRSHKTCPLCRAPILQENRDFDPDNNRTGQDGEIPAADSRRESELSIKELSPPIRRSVSMDSVSRIIVPERGTSANQSTCLQKGSVPVKRVNSTGSNLFSFRHCRTPSSVLPL